MAPCVRTASTLMGAVVTGITTTASMPSRDAERATPWAWLPAEAAMTPPAASSGVSARIRV